MTNNNILDNLSDSFKYAISDPKKILIGAAFMLIYFIPIDIIALLLHIEIIDFNTSLILMAVNFVLLMIPISILLGGYYIKIMRTTLEGANTLPEWVGFFNLFKDGILLIIGQILVSIVFMIIPLIIMIVGAILIMPEGMFETIKIEYISTYIFILFIGMLLSIPFMILNGFYSILASINFAKSGFFGFFDYKEVLNKFSFEYVLLVIILFVLLIVSSIVISVVLFIPSILLAFIDNAVLTFVFGLITSIILSIFSITMTVFSYRAYTTYYKNVV